GGRPSQRRELPVLHEAPAVVGAGLPAMPQLLRSGRQTGLGEDLQPAVGVVPDGDWAAGLTTQAVPTAPSIRCSGVLPDVPHGIVDAEREHLQAAVLVLADSQRIQRCHSGRSAQAFPAEPATGGGAVLPVVPERVAADGEYLQPAIAIAADG